MWALLNRALPDDIRVLGWAPVAADFSARFSTLPPNLPAGPPLHQHSLLCHPAQVACHDLKRMRRCKGDRCHKRQ